MSIEWSSSAPELLLTLDRASGEPLTSQLERQLRDAIRTGRLKVGERLPSSRQLARELELSRGLVQDCYGQLQAEGYLSTRAGSATRVASGAVTPPAAPPPPPPTRPERLLADFQSGVPDLASFPRGDWLWALREGSRAAPNTLFDYGDPRGSQFLREVLAGYLRRVRAAAAEPQHLLVCAGYQQGLSLALRTLARGGVTTVACEDPGPVDGNAAVAASAGLRLVPVPVDDDGIDVTALAATDARAVILTPAHQWPTGVVLAPARRRQLVDWANRHDATIIEDDYDAEFRYDREPVGSLHGLAADRVLSLGTVSKSLAPTIRLGWMLCPPALTRALSEEKQIHDRGCPGLDQLALATLISSGRYDRHLRRMRSLYAARRLALSESLARHAPAVRLTGLAAGFHALAHLPDGVTESGVISEARQRSVGLYGLSPLTSGGRAAPARLVLGFGNLPERTIRAGITAVADLLSGPVRPAGG
ncbi:PLP-dependent aminotransferase family protein [Plantactinospora sp. S1510]|uniref:PLP-dependent aminotransferase family protein n=1 Tax=Plantactinospora alkalitolerans TaxID=2789879 RepID=A0ABS0H3D4_9ACTN|nr:PLP-dependent aminotransferase family protein [Plantactinospora alkalitolerans]MBF9132964.1 PLP-dependent aminotransferase family protein [Plantactinospora alkalitolerans]